MAGNASDFLEDRLLNHVLHGSNTYTKPTSVWIALYTVVPTDGQAGTLNEVTVAANSYSRKQVTFGLASGGSIANNANIDFSNMPACTINGVGILDSNLSNANLLFWSDVTPSRTLVAGDSIRINSGALVVSLN